MFNKAQPPRPDYTDDGTPLLYRTQPKKQTRMPKFFSISHILACCRLYRAARADDIPEQVAIADLYDFTMDGAEDIISKNAMGHAVVNSLLYEPRKLLNRKSMKPTMTYRLLHKLDLQYGLEWQICSVMYRWLTHTGEFPKEQDQWHSKMEEILEELAVSDHTDYLGLYEEPLIEDSGELIAMEPDWITIMKRNPERDIRNIPKLERKEREPRTPPRDLSVL